MANAPIRILAHLRWRFQFGQEVVAGLVNSMGIHRIELLTASGESALGANDIASLRPRAIVGDSHYEATRAAAAELEIPFIDVTGSSPADAAMHRVLVDDATVGTLAADFLRTQGVRSFAFVGFSDQAYSQRRATAFAGRLGGAPCAHFDSPLATDVVGGNRDRRLSRFLRQLPLPCGLLACSDLRAVDVLVAAAACELAVPGDLRVLGVDVDRTLRGLIGRQLTSVDQSAWFVGWKAGQLAERLLREPHLPPATHWVPAIRVVEGDTTGATTVDDTILQRLLVALDQHLDQPDALALALKGLPLSRRAVENRCRQHLGRSPQELLHRRRLDEATRLLAQARLPIHEVAERLGFAHPGDFTRFLRRQLGMAPRELRQRLSAQPAA